jgi:hypothetical protein
MHYRSAVFRHLVWQFFAPPFALRKRSTSATCAGAFLQYVFDSHQLRMRAPRTVYRSAQVSTLREHPTKTSSFMHSAG